MASKGTDIIGTVAAAMVACIAVLAPIAVIAVLVRVILWAVGA